MRKQIDLEKFMEWVKGYKIYDHLSLEILATIPDDYVEQAVIDRIYRKFGDLKITDLKTELDVASNMSLGLQMVYSTADYGAKLNAGGFRDYFLNTPYRLIEMTLSSLRLISATEHCQLLQTARNILLMNKMLQLQ